MKEPKMVISTAQLNFIKKYGTAYKLAKESGVTQQAILDFMNGRQFMQAAKLKKICDVMGIPLSEFFAMGEGKNAEK